MESCLLVCNRNKPKERKGKVLFIDAKKEIRFELSNAYLDPKHIDKITQTYKEYKNITGFSKIVEINEILSNSLSDLSVQLYVRIPKKGETKGIDEIVKEITENEEAIGSKTKEFLSKIPDFQIILRGKKLTTYKWKDCVTKLTRKIDPVKIGIERIVAGGNLESEDFKIRSWGTVGIDFLGPAFHILFEPGDILYGSRRTYLKKVAVADFRGVCANTTFVIRANEAVLLQDYLKHIMLSERFTNYSISKSKGSTNPYINWKDLDDFTLELPDIETQRQLVAILDFNLELVEQIMAHSSSISQLRFKMVDQNVN